MSAYYMAIKTLCRSPKHGESQNISSGSCVNRVAYMTRMSLKDERTGITYNYRHGNHKKADATIDLGIVYQGGQILTNEKNRINEYSEFWSQIELAEKRKDSRTARTMILALPYGLDGIQEIKVIQDFQNFLVSEYGAGVHAVIHLDNKNNHHAHIAMTTREIGEGCKIGAKIRDLDTPKTAHFEIEKIKAKWADINNEILKPQGIQIDHRSYKRQGISKIPQKHQGPAQHHIAKRELSTLDDELKLIKLQIEEENAGNNQTNTRELHFNGKKTGTREKREETLPERGNEEHRLNQSSLGRNECTSGRREKPSVKRNTSEDGRHRKRPKTDMGLHFANGIWATARIIAKKIRLKRLELAKQFYDEYGSNNHILTIGNNVAKRIRLERYERTSRAYKQQRIETSYEYSGMHQ